MSLLAKFGIGFLVPAIEIYLFASTYTCKILIAYFLWSQFFQELIDNLYVNLVILQDIQDQLLLTSNMQPSGLSLRTIFKSSPSILPCVTHLNAPKGILRHYPSFIHIIYIFIYDTFRWFIFIIRFHIYFICTYVSIYIYIYGIHHSSLTDSLK